MIFFCHNTSIPRILWLLLVSMTLPLLILTPLELNLKLLKEEGNLLSNPEAYHTLVGNLVYLTITKPDISYVVQHVS